ncbi:MAG: response regulator, partial [Bacteroidales bacterium]|nr:response regulator [Bacteroidales bacterium]
MNTMEQNNQNSMVLIVDDTPKNIQVIGSILMEQKYRISVAKNGREALKVVKDVKPDIILLDIMMPELDGFETCKQLKESPETRDIPVIFLTAKIETEDIVKAFELGAVDYVIKPFNAKELLVRVNTHLDLKYAHEKIKKSEQELQKVNKAIKSQRDELARTLENLKQTQSQLIESK